ASFMSISWSCAYAVQLIYWYDLSSLRLLAIPWLIVMVLYYILIQYFHSAGTVILAYIYALFTDSLWDIFYLSSGILTTTIFIPMVALFQKNSTKVQVQSAATAGFISTFIFYFLEKNGILQRFQPEWLSDTGLGYIMWGFLVSFVAYSATKKLRKSGTR
ncbi:MAG: hypothetical protein O6943_06260, partial [Bacteroidetes bacterium]|nr:hypothetical protein [Bacteroidota bacterium]